MIKNASIYTVDGENSIAEAIAVKDGLIVYVGNDKGVETFIGSNTKVMDLEGKMVSPGYIDGHLHSYLMAESIFWLDLSKYSTFKDYETAIKNFLVEHSNLVQFRASGWNEAVTQTASKEFGLTHREMIDKLVSDIPFVAISGGHHEVWANSKAIKNAGVNANTPNPSGGNIDRDSLTGEPTGIFREFSAQDLVIQVLPQPDFTVEEYKEATLIFQEKAAENGITAAFVPIHYSTTSLLDAFEELDNEGKLTLTYELGPWTDSNRGPEQVADFIKIRDQYHGENYNVSSVKVFATGDTDDENMGATGDTGLVWDQDNLNATVAELDRAGFTVHAHANGDGQGVKAMLKAIEYAEKQNGKKDSRHAISHIPIVTEEDIEQFKELNVIPVPQPGWFFRSKGLEAGDPRLANLNRMKSYFDAGLPVASSSDFPVIDFNPLRGVEGGITRLLPTEDDLSKTLWPAESVTLEQMLTSYTINTAYQMKAEDKTGSIEVGHLVTATNNMSSSMRDIITNIGNSTKTVLNYSEELSQSSREVKLGADPVSTTMYDMASGSENQANSANEISTMMTNLSGEIAEASEHSENIRLSSNEVMEMTDKGNELMHESTKQMAKVDELVKTAVYKVHGLDEKAQEISKLNAVIGNIANQTNLLALNAAIEAARAGEHGKVL